MVSGCSMEGDEGMLGLIFIISDVAVPSVTQLNPLFLTRHIMDLLLGGEFYLECLQISGN